jgi:hypothetical protein
MAASIIIWIILGLLLLFGLIAIIVARKTKGRHKTDYYALFVMGITWIPLGIILMSTDSSIGNIFFILGLVYMAIGLAHKKEWKKNHVPFSKLSNKKKRMKRIMMIISGLLILIGLIVFYFLKKGGI